MLTITNEATLDAYTKLLTLESTFGGRLVYVVANNSAVAQFKPLREHGGSETAEWGPEIVLTPQSSFIDKVSAARFRSAVAGSAARVIAQLTEPGDILPASGTPFTTTLSASGAVMVGQRLALVEFFANVSTTVGTELAPQTIVDSGNFDPGGSPIVVEFYSPEWAMGGAANSAINLWRNLAVDLGRIAQRLIVGGTMGVPVNVQIPIEAPPAGLQSYQARLWTSAASNSVVGAGLGGVGATRPGHIAVYRALV